MEVVVVERSFDSLKRVPQSKAKIDSMSRLKFQSTKLTDSISKDPFQTASVRPSF